MAGRPIKMAEKVTALEAKMSEVFRLFLDCLPDQYSNRRPTDPLGQAWNDTMNAFDEAEEYLEELAEMLREKAGVTWEATKARIAELQGESVKAEPAAAGGT